MHYRNGREAKVGDRVVGADSGGNPIGGVLVYANGNATSCNGRVVCQSAIQNAAYVNLGDLLHADDLPAKETEKAS